MIVVLFGAPGSGKGTQGALLLKAFAPSCLALSTGTLLRRHVQSGSPLGQQVAAVLAAGNLVSDEVMLELLQAELAEITQDLVLLDGYPRTLAQAKSLAKLSSKHQVGLVIALEVPFATLEQRLLGRLVCGACGANYHVADHPPKQEGVCDSCAGALVTRSDDSSLERVKHRLDTYQQETAPVLAYYQDQGLVETVSGVGAVAEVFARVQRVAAARVQ